MELSGFGKFVFSKRKANKAMEKFLSQKSVFEKILSDETISEQKRKNIQSKLTTVEKNIVTLKPKLHNED